jgi:serine O-acetyltransferase
MAIPEDKKFFARDIAKYYHLEVGERLPTFMEKFNLWINHLGLHCVAVYRFGQFAMRIYRKSRLLGFIPKSIHYFLRYFICLVYHVDLETEEFGPGLYIGHIGGIYIGALRIGKNFNVTHNVTIGLGHAEGKEGRPIIGDNVWIGTGSTVAGDITVGNNVTIMPGTFLTRSIPDGCLVGGNPARIVAQNYDNSKMFG